MSTCEVEWCECHVYPEALKHGDDPRPFKVALREERPRKDGGTETLVWVYRVECVVA